MTKVLTSLIILVAALSCHANSPVPESIRNVKVVVERLDSAVTAMYGWEPDDSTYNKSVDMLVSGIINNYSEVNPAVEPVEESEPAIKQETYDSAKLTWAGFKRLIDADKYEEALDYYFADRVDGEGKNAGDFLVFLKHSTYRYTFDSEVLLPMMRELRGERRLLTRRNSR